MKTIFNEKILNKIHVFAKFQIEIHGWTLPNVDEYVPDVVEA